MADIRAFFANFPSIGEKFTQIEGRSVRTLIPLNLNGYEIELHQHPKIIVEGIKELRCQWIHTSNVLVKHVSKRQLKFVMQLLEDLADVLAFATLSRVEFFGFEYPDGSGKSRRWTSRGELDPSWPLVDRIVGASTSHLIQTIWPQYQALKEKRRLSIIINYIV